jgi:m7GpppX diphosphatase
MLLIFQKAIKEKYGIPCSQLRIYIHYQPSFYHLHVHFTYLKYDAPGIVLISVLKYVVCF